MAMKLLQIGVALMIGASLAPSLAVAQSTSGSKSGVGGDGLKASEAVSAGGPLEANGAGTDAKAGLSKPIFQLATEGGNINGVFDIGLTSNFTNIDYRSDANGGSATLSARSERFALKANIPIAKKSETGLFDLKGLANGATATLGYSRFWTKYEEGGQTYKDIYNPAYRKCLVENNGDGKGNAVIAEFDRLLASNKAQRGHTIMSNDIIDVQPTLSALAKPLAIACDPQTHGDEIAFITKFARESDVHYIEKNVVAQHPIYFLGVDATVGYDKHDVLDRLAFNVGQTGKFAYDGTVYAGVIGKKGDWSLKLAGSYTRAYKDTKNVEICKAISGGTQQECISGPDGRPIKDESAYVSGEFKWLIALGQDRRDADGKITSAKRIAIAPKVTWDVDDKSWALEVPVYLKADANGKLNGGVRFGYRSDKKDFGVGVFVDVPFGDIF
jgi:hypothetical protein